jgi:hypothetical protein
LDAGQQQSRCNWRSHERSYDAPKWWLSSLLHLLSL